MIDDDVEKESTIKEKTPAFNTPNTIPASDEYVTMSEGNKNEEKTPEIDIIVLKDVKQPAETPNTMPQRIIEISTAAVIVNNRITTLATFQLRPTKGSTNLNVLKAHTNIFSAMKLIDLTIKLITFQNEIIDISDQFPFSAVEYTFKFKKSTNVQNSLACKSHTKLNLQFHLAT